MGETKSQRMVGALDAFISTSPDVEAAAVVSFDGLTMASALPDDMEEDRVGAMSAALLSLGEQAAQGLGRGELQQLFVEADDGFVFLMSARDEAVLVAVTGRHAKIGFMLYEMRRAADDLGSLLESQSSPIDLEADDEAAQEATADAASDAAANGAPRAPDDEAPDTAAETAPEAAADAGRDPALGAAPDTAPDAAIASGSLAREEPAASSAHAGYQAGLRDPFGVRDLDDPHYLTANGRERDGADHGA